MAAIRVISAPPGEAPPEIREAWIGLVLPLVVSSPRRGLVTSGVLTGPKTYLTQRLHLMVGKGRRFLFGSGQAGAGYVVNAQTAITLLTLKNPQAAEWWQSNAPHSFAPGHTFIFAAEACEEAEDIVWPPPPNSLVDL